MKPSKHVWVAMLCLALCLLANSCSEYQITNVVPPGGGNPGPYTGNIVGRVDPPTSAARVIAAQASPVDSTTIDPDTGAFALTGLGPGTYDVIIRADAHRIETLEGIAVLAGSVSYVGAVELSTTPDPVRSFAPLDRSEVVMYYGPNSRLAIGIDFMLPMDRASVQAAFSTEPPTDGIYYWSQFPSVTSTDWTGARESDAAPAGYQEVQPGGEITTFRNIRSLRFVPRQRDTFVDSLYVVKLARTAHDSAGEEMRFPLQFSFRTIQSGSNQTTIQTWPEDGAENVNLLAFGSLRITFPKKMNRASVENALTITPATAPIFLWLADHDLTLYTGGPLRALTTYTVHIDDTARDLDGSPLPQPYEFSFTTEPVAVRGSSPANGQVFADFTTNLRIVLWFNTYIVRSTLAQAWSIVPPVSGQFYWTDNTYLYFQPTVPLAPNTKYTVTIGAAMRDLHGARLPVPFSFAFVTRPD